MKNINTPLLGGFIVLGASCFILIGSAIISQVKRSAELPGLVAAERERLRPTPEFSSQEEAYKACLEHLKSLSSDYYCDVSDTATSRGNDLSCYSRYLNKTTGVSWHLYEEYGTVYPDSPLKDLWLPEREFVFSK